MRAAFLLLMLSGCGIGHKAEIEPGAVSMMTPDHWPTMLAQLGPAAFARANSKMQAAADFAAADRKCSRVTYVGVSQSGSTAQRIEWFVDCEDDYRVRFSENDLLT